MLLQGAEDLFDPIAGLNSPGVLASFRTALTHSRAHIARALQLVCSGGNHEDICYEFQAGTSLLMALFDGIAVYVERKVASSPPPPGPGHKPIYWAAASTFSDPRFDGLCTIKVRTSDYIIKGGITANSLRNFAKHYLPWVPLASIGPDGFWDIRFPLDAAGARSGPVLRGLLCPLFGDARAACIELGNLLGQDTSSIEAVPLL